MLKDYLGLPEDIIGIGKIYPVTIREIDEFRILSWKSIMIGKTTIKNRLKIDVDFLLDFYIGTGDGFVDEFKRLLEITLKERIDFVEKEEKGEYGFRIHGKGLEVNKHNFDIFREIIMRQNLLHEPLTEEDDLMQEWLELARETKMRGREVVDIESMCQLVALIKGVNPNNMANYTYYQLIAENSRISLIDTQQYIMLLRSQGVEEPIPNTSKALNLHENPEEDLFKKENIKSSGEI